MALQVSVVIPAYNEADLIGKTIESAKSIPGVAEIIVVDDASSDDTSEVARAAGADRVLKLRQNRGKGGALNEAWPLTTHAILLLLDADLGTSASEGSKLLEPVLSGDADMAVAVFGSTRVQADQSGVEAVLAARSGGFGTVMRVARWGIRRLTGQHVRAPLSGPRALKREIVEKAGGFAPKFGVEVALTIDALRNGCRLVEVPVDMVHRASGRSLRGFLHRGKQLMDVLRTLSRKAIER